jgi:hypothetical protein
VKGTRKDERRAKISGTTALHSELLKNEEFKKSLGRGTTTFLLASLAIAAVELTIGIPVITLSTAPIAGALVAYLLEQTRSWILSGKPQVIFYFCPGLT